MKVLLGVAAAALLMGAPAMAQTDAGAANTSCAAVAPPPTLPDGATATYEQMEAANTAYSAWFESNRAALECRRVEVEAVEARRQALLTAYNGGVDQLNATKTSWEAEVEEFNARAPQQQRRDPRSIHRQR